MIKIINKSLKGTLLALLGLSLNACSSGPPLKTVSYVDQQQFAGKWYVVANIDNFLERNKVAATTTFLEKSPGVYKDIFRFRNGGFDQPEDKIVGKAKSANDANTVWQSTFYTIIRSKFEVLSVDSNYQLMLLGHRSRNYGWIFSRTPLLSDKDHIQAMSIFKDNGYDTSRFLKVPQLVEQIGQPGFHTVQN